jgi:hypothetical protein
MCDRLSQNMKPEQADYHHHVRSRSHLTDAVDMEQSVGSEPVVTLDAESLEFWEGRNATADGEDV